MAFLTLRDRFEALLRVLGTRSSLVGDSSSFSGDGLMLPK